MMVNAQSGRISTGACVAPGAASQSLNGRAASLSSSAISVARIDARTGAIASPTVLSTNSSRASASSAIVARLSGEEEGASGATATPARNAPRNTAAYAIEVAAQLALASRG